MAAELAVGWQVKCTIGSMCLCFLFLCQSAPGDEPGVEGPDLSSRLQS